MIRPMSYRILNKILLLFLILFISSSLSAIEKTIKDSSEANFFSVGVGLMYQLTFSYLNGDTYYALRHFGQFNPLAGLASNITPVNYEFGLLYGKTIPFNTKNIGFIALSTGLSYVRLVREGKEISYEHYEKKEIHAIGIPFELQIIKGFTRYTTFGLSLTMNLNKEENLYGTFINLGFGNFKNYRYKPTKGTQSLINSFLKLSNNISFEFNPIRTFIFLNKNEIAFKSSFAFNKFLNNMDFIIPIYYRYSTEETLYYRTKRFFSIDVQLRKFILEERKKYYVNLGIQFFNIAGRYGYSTVDENYFGISAAFGYRNSLGSHFYFSNQLNVTKPIYGRMSYLDNVFAEDGKNSKNFILNLEILNIGIEF